MKNQVSKAYASKSGAKKALKRIFGVGPYSTNFTYASARFIDAEVNDNTLTLSSTYWGDSSLERALKSGVDSI